MSPDTAINPELQRRYQMVIGSLLYLMIGTRPDIAFAVTKLAQFAARPSEEHFDKALYICRYLRGTSKYCLTYDGTSGQGLIACTDSDWASDSNNRQSQTGYFLKLAGGAISWTSRAQKTVALSSTEAGCMALVRATLPNALNVINASSVGKLVQLVTASRLTLNHEGQVDPMKDECHYQIKH